jgi:hypothetical protein
MTTYITPDTTYNGRHTLRSNRRRSDVFTAKELSAMATPGTPLVVWEHSGTVQGVNLYVRTRFIAQEDGSLIGYSADGDRTIIHPADRRIRVMTK